MHRRPHLTRPTGVAATVLAAAAGLAGCTGTSGVQAAPRGADPGCVTVLSKVPGSVADQQRVADPAVGAASWGDPPIVLRCGLPASTPTTTPCLEVNGVDWLFEESGDAFRLTTYGLDPAVEVLVPASYGRSKANAAMVDLGPSVQGLAVERRCR